MNRRLVVTILLLSLVGALAAPLWAVAAPTAAGPVEIRLAFNWIRQGRVGLVHIEGDGVTGARAIFQGRVYNFYEDGQRLTALLSADMDREVGQYPMQVWIDFSDGTSDRIDRDVTVNYGEFGRSDVAMSMALQPLLEPEVELQEMNQLFNILERFTPERYWAEEGFVQSVNAELIGFFGAHRLYNGTYWRRHTGADYRVPPNTPIAAVASGRVMLAEVLDIRGGYVLIDHGWGVYSGFAHLNEIVVLPGQWIRQGEVVGLSGSTGRSGGAHLHWEMAVGGAWIEPESFVSLGVGGQ